MKANPILYLLFLLPVCALSLATSEAWIPKSGGPPGCFAGEPPRNSNCNNSGCHTGFPVNSGAGALQIDLDGAENGYNPGQLYRVKVALSAPGLSRGGFQTIALQDNNNTISPGTFTLTDLIRTQVIDNNFPHADTGCDIFSKVWIEHTESGIDDPIADTIKWGFDWRAPLNNVGSITFYVAALEANADLDATGDYVYSISKTIAGPPTSISTDPTNHFQLSPNPVEDHLMIDLQGRVLDQNDRVEIHDISGRQLLEAPITPYISLQNLPAGIYLAKFHVAQETWIQKFVKQ